MSTGAQVCFPVNPRALLAWGRQQYLKTSWRRPLTLWVVGDAFSQGRHHEGQRLERWAADASIDEAARRRARRAALRNQAGGAASLVGILRDLGERRATTQMLLSNGASHQGTVTAVGSDYIGLSGPSGVIFVVTDAIAAIRADPGEPTAFGDRDSPERWLEDRLTALVDQQTTVAVTTLGSSQAERGILSGVASDVLTLNVGDSAVYLNRAALASVSALDRR